MTTNATPRRRYTVDVEGEVDAYASKPKALEAFHAAAIAGRTVTVYTPAGHAAHGYRAEQGPVELVDGELRAATPAEAPTARRTYYVHHAVHVVQAGAENALCGVRLLGAIDTTADATCDRCKAHTFETTPGLWAKVAPIGDGELPVVGGLPESTGGFPTDRHDDVVETVRLTIRARELRRGDRVINLVAGRTVTVFDLELDVDVVELWPTQADLDDGAAWRYEAAAGESVVVDRQVHTAGFTPVQPAPAGELAELCAQCGAPEASLRHRYPGGHVFAVTAPAPAKIPTPKGPGHPALRSHRVHVRVSRPVPSKFRPGHTAQRVYTEGRFVTERAARRWAEATRQPGERASITFYSASDGWKGQAGPDLTDEGWRTTRFLDGRGGDPA